MIRNWILIVCAGFAIGVDMGGGAARAGEPFDYFQNSWSVIGLRDYRDGTRITPENELLLADKGRVRIRFGRELAPLSRGQTKTLQDGWLPIVQLTARDAEVHYEFVFWATPLADVKDWRAAFDGPAEGENFLNWIRVRVTNTGGTATGAKLVIEDSVGRPRRSEWTLNAGASVESVERVPYRRPERDSAWKEGDHEQWLKRTAEYWRDLVDRAALIEVPCVKATQALKAAHVCQLIAADGGELLGGEGFYDEFYIRDGGYQIMELEEAGLWDAVDKALAPYLKSQRPDGRFETQKGQLDANGQGVWVLWQYYRITGDQAWLAKAYPQMRRAVDWAMKARREAPADSPFAGLLPVAVADGEFLWDGKHHIVGYDLWNLRAVLCTADAARDLGRDAEARELTAEAAAYRAAIDAALRRREKNHFPASWEDKGTFWGNTETLWPTEVFPPDDPRVAGTIEYARRRLGGGFVEGTIRWLGDGPPAIHPYMSAYTTMASLVRGEHEQVVEDFYWYLLHSTATNGFPEGIHYQRRFAWSDTIPHVTGASNYALMLRHMLIHERSDELHLLPAIPDWWLEDGREIRIERAPTHFGEVGLKVRGTSEGVEVTFAPPARRPPARTILHLPSDRVPRALPPGITLDRRQAQRQRWDLTTVIGLYEKTAPALQVGPSPGQTTPAP